MQYLALALLVICSIPTYATPVRYIVNGTYEDAYSNPDVPFPTTGKVTGWFQFDADACTSAGTTDDPDEAVENGGFTFKFFIDGVALNTGTATWLLHHKDDPITIESIYGIHSHRPKFSSHDSAPYAKVESLDFNYINSQSAAFFFNAIPCCGNNYFDVSASVDIIDSYTVPEPHVPGLLGIGLLVVILRRKFLNQ